METDFVARAEALAPLIREHADEAERLRHLPAPVAEALAAAGLYRMAAPAELHGAEADPITQIQVIEAVSRADGSAGWNLMIGVESFGLIAPGFRRCPDLIADPMTVLASSTAAVGRAEKVPEGWLVNGQWQFASGVHNAQLFGATVQLYDGGQLVDERFRYALVPKGGYEIVDTWNVSGLRGSGSHDVRIENVVVPDEHVISPIGPGGGETALLRFPLSARLAYNKVAVGLGIARAAVDAFVELAAGKKPRFASASLAQRPFAQRAVARAEARLQGARGATLQLVGEMWDRVVAGEPVGRRELAVFQLVCSDAALAAAEVVETLVEAAGTSANQVGHPLERLSRDARVIRQHVTVAPHHIEDGGRVLLGLEPEGMMLSMLTRSRPDGGPEKR